MKIFKVGQIHLEYVTSFKDFLVCFLEFFDRNSYAKSMFVENNIQPTFLFNLRIEEKGFLRSEQTSGRLPDRNKVNIKS